MINVARSRYMKAYNYNFFVNQPQDLFCAVRDVGRGSEGEKNGFVKTMNNEGSNHGLNQNVLQKLCCNASILKKIEYWLKGGGMVFGCFGAVFLLKIGQDQ